MDEDCCEKLRILLFQLKIMIKDCEDESLKLQYISFQEELEATLSLVEAFEIQKYRFFFGIEVSSKMRTTMVTIISSTLTGIGFALLTNV